MRDCTCLRDTHVSGGERQKHIRIKSNMTTTVIEVYPQGIWEVQRMTRAA